MNRDIASLLERKLVDALRRVDGEAEAAIRQAWVGIGPDPKTPFVSTTMGVIKQACWEGLQARERTAKEVVAHTLAPHRSRLSPKFNQLLMAVVTKQFSTEQYVALVEHTPGVYQRSLARASKFEERSYNVALALVKVQSANAAHQAIERMSLVLQELHLQAVSGRQPWWNVLFLSFWSLIAKPAVKWAFGILAGVVTAIILAFLGLK